MLHNRQLITESVSTDDIMDAIDNHKRVIINYHSKGEDYNTGPRVVEVYAYGLTKAGNPVIRGFQPMGDTTTKVPSWKFFRIDRISGWKPTKQTFLRPASFYYKGLGEFNPDGDETMSVVYKIADFRGNQMTDTPESGPRKKQDNSEVFKTDTEYRMERLKQQLDNPITLSDLKTQNGFDDVKPTEKSGPRLKDKAQDKEIYKTDTERGLERLKQQLSNPVTLSDYLKQNQQPQRKDKDDEIDTLRQKLGDTSKPMTLGDLNQKLSATDEPQKNDNDLYKTDTERGLDKLKRQLDNPQKIDLSKIPKR